MADYSESLVKSLIKKVNEYPRFSKDEMDTGSSMGDDEDDF